MLLELEPVKKHFAKTGEKIFMKNVDFDTRENEKVIFLLANT